MRCSEVAGVFFFDFWWVLSRFHKGDVLITASTGVMTEAEGEKWGLVPTHAYAVLDIREFKVLCCLTLVSLFSCSRKDIARIPSDA